VELAERRERIEETRAAIARRLDDKERR
jgi:hypothetical protein